MTLRLAKHHGLGNDFLIHLSRDPRDHDWSEVATRLCDRHTGIGADGLIIGTIGSDDDVDLTMALFNADGSVAEISGNGLRCLVHAEARRRGEVDGEISVATAAGRRVVSYEAIGGDEGSGALSVISARADMGPAGPGPEPDRDLVEPAGSDAPELATELALDAIDQRLVDIGNPHMVLRVADPHRVRIAEAGPLQEARFDAGMNVHVIANTAGEPDAIDLVIWERGAGVTAACGTGATAAARAAHDWGMVGSTVTVHMPGGDVEVEVGDPMYLIGTATHIADIEVQL